MKCFSASYGRSLSDQSNNYTTSNKHKILCFISGLLSANMLCDLQHDQQKSLTLKNHLASGAMCPTSQ